MLKIGVIGYGGRTGDLIKDVLLELKLDVEIVAFTDLDEAAARAGCLIPVCIPKPFGITKPRGRCWTARSWTDA